MYTTVESAPRARIHRSRRFLLGAMALILAAGIGTTAFLLTHSRPSYQIRSLATIADPGHGDSIAFSPDGRLLASGDTDGYARLWDVSGSSRARLAAKLPTGKSLDSLESGFRVGTSVAFSPNGHVLAVGDPVNEDVRLWNVADPAHPRSVGLIPVPVSRSSGNVVSALSFSPDGKTLVTGDTAGFIRFWSISDPARPVMLSSVRQKPGTGAGNSKIGYPVIYLTFSRGTASPVLASGSRESPGSVSLWNVADPAHPRSLTPAPGDETSLTDVTSLAFQPGGDILAIGGLFPDGRDAPSAMLWDARPGDEAAPSGPTVCLCGANAAPMDPVYTSFSPDGRILAADDENAGALTLLNTANPAHPVTYDTQVISGGVGPLTFSPDGRTLAVIGRKGIGLWRVPSPPSG
ncbi:MAG: WD40 repeat domain-containing protein [Nocardiopsaceae bacterium]|nr:WD40 repeat domain-containing protein [Nocardiopsaceae bacterium]